MGLTLAAFAAYGVFAASLRQHVISRPRVLTWMLTWMRRTFAGAFAALGIRLARAER